MIRLSSSHLRFFGLLIVLVTPTSTFAKDDEQFSKNDIERKMIRFDSKSVAAARDYMRIFDLKNFFTQSIPTLQEMFRTQIKLNNPNFSDDDIKDFTDEFIKIVYVDHSTVLEQMVLLVILETFDKNEIVAVRDFYSSPIGKRIIAKMPNMTKRMPEMSDIMQKHIFPTAIEAGRAKLKAKGKDIKL